MKLDDIRKGQRYTQAEIEDMFETNFWSILPHILPRRDKQDNRFILLFPTTHGPYGHEIGEETVRLVGEGNEGDQKENTPGNTTMIDAIEEPTPIFLFVQYEQMGEWEYKGPVDVLDYSIEIREEFDERVDSLGYVTDKEQAEDVNEDRQVLVFDLEFVDEPVADISLEEKEDQEEYSETSEEKVHSEKQQLQQEVLSEPRITDPIEYSESRKIARDYAFRETVLEAYEETCAICGSSRRSPDGRPEVEAAHIYPKGEGGTDDPRNGVALCRLHHWAFDNGWIGIDRDGYITVKQKSGRDEYEEFKELEGDKIRTPVDRELHPHPDFLELGQEERDFS